MCYLKSLSQPLYMQQQIRGRQFLFRCWMLLNITYWSGPSANLSSFGLHAGLGLQLFEEAVLMYKACNAEDLIVLVALTGYNVFTPLGILFVPYKSIQYAWVQSGHKPWLSFSVHRTHSAVQKPSLICARRLLICSAPDDRYKETVHCSHHGFTHLISPHTDTNTSGNLSHYSWDPDFTLFFSLKVCPSLVSSAFPPDIWFIFC